MFVDKARIKIAAGDGGAGCVSFHREKYVAAGGPDGGDGGKGGDVILVVDTHLSTLIDFKYKSKYNAKPGDPGGRKNCSGRNAQDLIIKVPKGTLVRDAETGRVICDMSTNEPVVVAKGGRGGWGNQHFATPTRQIPRFAKPGLPGEKLEVTLELKLLADVGLVGFPNVGKSTFISVVSEAKPKIANYHFTTLTPVLGVVRVAEEQSFVMADIPGLIEGASDGVGLGHAFLRHVERCRLTIHVVDISGSEGRDPKEDFELINKELANFSEEIADRPMIVVGNKCDIATEEQIEEFKNYVEGKGYKFFAMSAATVSGTREIIDYVYNEIEKLPPIKIYEPEAKMIETDTADKKRFEIVIEDGVYVVEADWLMNILASVNMEDYESLQYFQRVLRSSGIIDGLLEAGIQENDTVNICGFEFDFVL